jgi:hypothetical protein
VVEAGGDAGGGDAQAPSVSNSKTTDLTRIG